MKAVIQRVKSASVSINNNLHSEIGHGLLILFGVEKGDTREKLEWFCTKIPSLRIFEDENLKMNYNISDIKGELMVVSQFTLAADCKKGTRPSFDNAQRPEDANKMYELFISKLKSQGFSVKTGVFGAMMDIALVNDGPVTIILEK